MARKQARKTVTLVGVDYRGEKLLAMNQAWVLSQLTTYTTLREASTLRDVRSDTDALETVSGSWRFEELDDDGEFDAEEYFGDDYSWRPNAPFTSRAWLEEVLPGLLAELEQPDTGWGFDDEPVPFIHVDDRETVERALRQLGHQVVDFPRFAEFFDEPPTDWRDRLPAGTKV